MLYVGEGDPIRPRLESHYAQKDFWTRAIGFTTTTAGQLNKAHAQFLELRFIALARAAKRLPLDNAKVWRVLSKCHDARNRGEYESMLDGGDDDRRLEQAPSPAIPADG
jgi:hypothetical protein